MIAVPDFAAGAMENWGLITYRETALLYSKGQSSESNKQRVAVVIAHELAHQVRSIFFRVYGVNLLLTRHVGHALPGHREAVPQAGKPHK